jgi:hypothetical protein
MKPLPFYLGLFLVTGSGLMLQVVQTRILSATTWYYLAFLLISLAMFGITAGAVWVYQRRDRFTTQTLAGDLTYFSSLLAVVTALCVALQTTLPLVRAQSVAGMFAWLALIACLALPFFLSGIIVSLALTRSPLRIGKVYAVDMAGAAAGSIGALLFRTLRDRPRDAAAIDFRQRVRAARRDMRGAGGCRLGERHDGWRIAAAFRERASAIRRVQADAGALELLRPGCGLPRQRGSAYPLGTLAAVSRRGLADRQALDEHRRRRRHLYLSLG